MMRAFVRAWRRGSFSRMPCLGAVVTWASDIALVDLSLMCPILEVTSKDIHLVAPTVVIMRRGPCAKGRDQVLHGRGDQAAEQVDLLFWSLLGFECQLIELGFPRPVVGVVLAEVVELVLGPLTEVLRLVVVSKVREHQLPVRKGQGRVQGVHAESINACLNVIPSFAFEKVTYMTDAGLGSWEMIVVAVEERIGRNAADGRRVRPGRRGRGARARRYALEQRIEN